MLNSENEKLLARLRSSQESFNGNVKGGITAEHIPGGFFVLEGV